MPKYRYNAGEDSILPGTRVSVRNDDVNGALRKLKKTLEREDRQKDLAKHEYFEKPSIKRKRARDIGRRRQQHSQNDLLSVTRRANPTGTKWMKSKRKRRKVLDAQTQLRRLTR